MTAVTICSDFGAPQNKVCHCFPIYFPWSDGARCHDLSFLTVEPGFSLSSFIFIKRLFSCSLLSAIRMVLSAYLRLLIFLLAILIPACASSNPAFLMMYSAYKLNKQGDNIQPWHTPFPIWNPSVVPCPVLTVASWPAYRFLRRQVRWSGIPISFRIFHSLLWSTHSKALAIVSKAEIEITQKSLMENAGCFQKCLQSTAFLDLITFAVWTWLLQFKGKILGWPGVPLCLELRDFSRCQTFDC